MAELQLKSHRFRAEREADWRRLESLLNRVERGGARKLNRDELVEMPALYRQALSSLSMARAISLGWLRRHEIGTYVKFTPAGAEMFA